VDLRETEIRSRGKNARRLEAGIAVSKAISCANVFSVVGYGACWFLPAIQPAAFPERQQAYGFVRDFLARCFSVLPGKGAKQTRKGVFGDNQIANEREAIDS